MRKQDQESGYSAEFRKEEISSFAEHIKLHHSIELVGMKRVGINNFIRYFLSQKSNLLTPEYIVFMIDLNNLIERDLFAFWRLTLKRIVDAIRCPPFSSFLKEKATRIFDNSIQSNDIFLTFDATREIITLINQMGFSPILILNRFDRLKDVVTPEFFDNLISLRDASKYKMSFVFTGYRELKTLSPSVFQYAGSSGFSQIMYIKPAIYSDSSVVADAIKKRYSLDLSPEKNKKIIELAGGHIQYLRLCLLNLHEFFKQKTGLTDSFISRLKNDERITFLSEELWESLNDQEKEILKKIVAKKRLSSYEKQNLAYVEKTGFIYKEKKRWRIFSPLFSDYIERIIESKTNGHGTEFTKQEYKLYKYLASHENSICERDTIINEVWPESKEWGATDWSLDKLIARVRQKLQKQNSHKQIITIRTRGYKLISL